MSASNGRPLLIGALARAAGVTQDAIRFYERQGLLPAPRRLPSGYRSYDSGALKRLSFIKQAQTLGFSLDDVRRVLALRERGEPACDCVVQIAEQTLRGSRAKLRDLQTFVDALDRRLKAWKSVKARKKNAPAEFCALIESSSQ